MLNITEIFFNKKNLIWLILMAMMGGIFGGYLFLVHPPLQVWLEQERKNDELKIQIVQQHKELQELQKFIDSIKKTRAHSQSRKILPNFSESVLLKQLMQIAEKNSLQINILMPLETQDKGYFKQQIIHMAANGNFQQIKQWLQDLVVSEPAVIILKFSLQNNSSATELMVDVLLAFYSEK